MTMTEEIVAALADGRPLTPKELAHRLKRSSGAVRKLLASMAKGGEVVRVGHGLYALGNDAGNDAGNNIDDAEKIRRARSAYAKEWRRRNPDRARAYWERFHLKLWEQGYGQEST